MSLMETLASQLDGNAVRTISSRLGADEATTSKAISAALPTLMGAMARNSAQPTGAASLHRALDDHDGGLLDNLGGFLGQSDAGPGAGILRHVLGGRQDRVQNGISQASGLAPGKVQQLLAMLAPMVLAHLGKAKKQQGLDVGGLASMLSGEQRQIEATVPQAGLLGNLLDQDGDGDVDLSDVTKGGLGKLGKLFG